MNFELLTLLRKNARYSNADLAAMLDISEQQVIEDTKYLESNGIIRGYKAIVDWEKVEDTYVSAIVHLNVVPKAGLGFEEVAEKIMSFSEVESIYLVSGTLDLSIVVKGRTLQDVSRFVSKELATIDSVTSTVTNFVMRRYKDIGVELFDREENDGGQFMYD